MPYVKLNENRKQIEYSMRDNIGEKIDCIAPSENHTLKSDYKNFKGEAQWGFSATAQLSNALAESVFNMRDIQDACDIIDSINENTALNNKLDLIMSNSKFARHLIGASGTVDLGDDVTKQALSQFTESEIEAIKKQIAGIE